MSGRGGGGSNTNGGTRGGSHNRGGGGGGGGGRRGGNNNNNNNSSTPSTRPKKEQILDLSRYTGSRVRVQFVGGREVTGVLSGYDGLMSLVLDDVRESDRDCDGKLLTSTRSLGQVVVRGPTLVMIAPVDGSEEIPNPFVQPEA